MFTSNLTVDPLFTSTTDLHLLTGSPMIGAGVASWGTGTAPLYDHDGRLRPSPPSVGAYEFSAAVSGSPTVGLSPTSLNFSNQLITIASGQQTVTLTNTGTAALMITSVTLTGADTSHFAISSNPCGASLAPSANCVIGVTFTPTTIGVKSANLTITTNAVTSPDNTALSGTGSATVFGIGNINVQGNVTIKP
jgi:hypothetical protein